MTKEEKNNKKVQTKIARLYLLVNRLNNEDLNILYCIVDHVTYKRDMIVDLNCLCKYGITLK